MARLPDICDISRRIARHRRLPRLQRRPTAHDAGVHHGQPTAESPADGHLAARLFPVGHRHTGIDRRDVHVRSAVRAFSSVLRNSRMYYSRTFHRSLVVSDETRQR